MAINTTKLSSINPYLKMLYFDILIMDMKLWKSDGRVWIQYKQNLPYDMTPHMMESYNRILTYAVER